MRIHRARYLLLGGLEGLLLTSALHAAPGEWPMERQNAYRTGHASGEGILTTPAVRARALLGGSGDGFTLYVDDLDQDGRQEVAIASGGKIVVRDAGDRVLWDTLSLQATDIMGAFDFDGDGAKELEVSGPDGVWILRGRDGEVLWHKTNFKDAANDVDLPGQRIADITGDGLPDIVLKAFWNSDGLVHAYSFGKGFDLANPDANQLWAYTIEPGFKTGYYVTLGDVNNDGLLDAVNATSNYLEVFPATTGGKSTFLIDCKRSLYYGRTQLVNLDDDPQLEVVHHSQASSKSIEVFDVVSSPTTLVAEQLFGSTDSMSTPTNAVGDLDGDGIFEIVVNRFDASGSKNWHGLIYQYVPTPSGTTEATLEQAVDLTNEMIMDLIDVDQDGHLEVLTRGTTPGKSYLKNFDTLKAYDFDGGLVEKWSIGSAKWQQYRSRGSADLNPVYTSGVSITSDVNLDGAPDFFVTTDDDGDQYADHLRILDVHGDAPVVLASRSMAVNSRMTVLYAVEGLSDPDAGPEILALESGGVLRVLDDHLVTAPDTLGIEINGLYSNAPLVADLDGDGHNELLIRGSAALLSAQDPLSLDPSAPSDAALWYFDGANRQYGITLDVEGDGVLEVVTIDAIDPTRPRLELLDADGFVKDWLELPAAPSNLLAGQFVGSSAQDVYGSYRGSDGLYYLFVVDGEQWELAWPAVQFVPASSNPNFYDLTSVAYDAEGDGTYDIAFGQDGYLCRVKGEDGNQPGCYKTDLYSGSLMVGPVGTDGENAFASVGWQVLSMISLELNPQWSKSFSSSAVLSRYGTLAPLEAEESMGLFVAAQNAVYAYLPDGTQLWSVALQAGTVGEIVSSVTLSGVASGDVDGDGVAELLLGSTDGFLYCLESETGDIEWVLELFYAVGDPIVADVDDDALLDVAVAAADGYVYLVTQAGLPAPSNIRDVAVSASHTLINPSTDVETSEVVECVGGAWDAVPGAAGYNVAVLSDHNTYIQGWRDVGAITEVVICESRLVYNHAYYLVVQAYDAGLVTSPWGYSDGIRIIDESSPTVSTVRANPNPFCPETHGTTLIHGNLQDTTGLKQLEAYVLTSGGVAVFYQSQAIGGTSYYAEVAWDGKDFERERVPDGIYTLRFIATDVGDNSSQAQGTLEVFSDDTLPQVDRLQAVPDPFTPELDHEILLSAVLTDDVGLLAYRLEVFSPAMESLVLREGSATGLSDTITETWNGTDPDGFRVPDGIYTFEFTAVDEAGWSAADSETFEVITDETVPTVTDLQATPDPFIPEMDGVITLSAHLADPTGLASASLEIFGPSGVSVFFTEDSLSGLTHPLSKTWDGNDKAGARVPEGLYRVVVTATDVDANSASLEGNFDVGPVITPVPETPTPVGDTPTLTPDTPTLTPDTPTPAPDTPGPETPAPETPAPTPGALTPTPPCEDCPIDLSPTPPEDPSSCECSSLASDRAPSAPSPAQALLALVPLAVIVRRRRRTLSR